MTIEESLPVDHGDETTLSLWPYQWYHRYSFPQLHGLPGPRDSKLAWLKQTGDYLSGIGYKVYLHEDPEGPVLSDATDFVVSIHEHWPEWSTRISDFVDTNPETGWANINNAELLPDYGDFESTLEIHDPGWRLHRHLSEVGNRDFPNPLDMESILRGVIVRTVFRIKLALQMHRLSTFGLHGGRSHAA